METLIADRNSSGFPRSRRKREVTGKVSYMLHYDTNAANYTELVPIASAQWQSKNNKAERSMES